MKRKKAIKAMLDGKMVKLKSKELCFYNGKFNIAFKEGLRLNLAIKVGTPSREVDINTVSFIDAKLYKEK